MNSRPNSLCWVRLDMMFLNLQETSTEGAMQNDLGSIDAALFLNLLD